MSSIRRIFIAVSFSLNISVLWKGILVHVAIDGIVSKQSYDLGDITIDLNLNLLSTTYNYLPVNKGYASVYIQSLDFAGT
jgi:hypothetical protein